MTSTEAKALAKRASIGLTPHEAGVLAHYIEATEARHAAELREQAERFSEVLGIIRHKTVPEWSCHAFDELAAPFILPKSDPMEDVLSEAGYAVFPGYIERVHAGLAARGYEVRKIGEAGE